MLRSSGIYIATKLEDVFSPVVLTKGSETLHLYLLPYIEPADVRQYFQDESIQVSHGISSSTFRHTKIIWTKMQLTSLVGHCFAAGSQTCDSESAIYVGGSGEVGSISGCGALRMILLFICHWNNFALFSQCFRTLHWLHTVIREQKMLRQTIQNRPSMKMTIFTILAA